MLPREPGGKGQASRGGRNRELRAERRRRCPAQFLEFNPRHPDIDQRCLATVLAWRPDAKDGKGLGLISAESGLAKTRMIWALLHDLHFAGIRWRAMAATDLARLYGTNFEDRGEAEAEVERLCNAAVLFIDDLGKERCANDAIAERLFHIIDRRYAMRLPLLWTSNLSADAIATRLGERGEKFVRRLRDSTLSYRVVKGRQTHTPARERSQPKRAAA